MPIYAAEEITDEEVDTENQDLDVGGVLLDPLISLISGVGEGVIWVLQSQLLGMGTSNRKVTVQPGTDIIQCVIAGAVGGAAGGAATGATGGTITVPIIGTVAGTGGGAVIQWHWTELL